jgi:hypothetical protein
MATPEPPPEPDLLPHEGAVGRSVELDERRPIVRDNDWPPRWWWPPPRKRWAAWMMLGFLGLCVLLAVLGTALGRH